MNYQLKENQNNDNLIKSTLSSFEKKVLATYPNDVIDDYLLGDYEDIIFNDMNEVVKKINYHLKQKHDIVIVGDYDCDGILGTSILVKAFAKIGVKVGYYIPNRLTDGYGLNLAMVKMFSDNDYQLIITVDNGVKAKAAIELAHDIGIDVIVSDHHTFDEDDLCADTCYLHPCFSNIDYAISGGLVAYHLARALIGSEDEYLKTLATITLISDVMPIMKDNRLLIKDLLKQDLNYPQLTLLAKNKLNMKELNNNVIPKINALGRLADKVNPNKLVPYFCTNNMNAVKEFSAVIEEVNTYRKALSNEYYQKYQDIEPINNLIFIEDDNIHEGIIGLLATRLAHAHNCVVLIATANNNHYKASLRAVKQIDIYAIVSQLGAMLDSYGGHQNAMGITYSKEVSELLKNSLRTALGNITLNNDYYEVIELKKEELTLTNAYLLDDLEPFGNSFNKPLFLIKQAKVVNLITFKSGIHHKITIVLDDSQFDIVIFNEKELALSLNEYYDFIVEMSVNTFRNSDSLQLISVAYDLAL